ncbi:MAG: serine hydrolase, partial [Chloroflexota bacterium]|nr:serine hydrolase [Chloroflexota bacterium]
MAARLTRTSIRKRGGYLMGRKIALAAWLAMLTCLLPASVALPASSESGTVEFSDQITEQLDTAITKFMQEANLPGVVVGVWVPGEGQYVAAKGKANLDTGLSRDLTDPFRIASITKPFTATAVLQLVDEGKLRTSDK